MTEALRVGSRVAGSDGRRYRVVRIDKYDPNQPRDEAGRWTVGGGASGVVDPNDKSSWVTPEAFDQLSRVAENATIAWEKKGRYWTNRDPLVLYHGTSGSRALIMETEGLKFGNLTPDPRYAEEIGRVRREGEAAVVFRVDAPAGSVYPVHHGPKSVATDALALAKPIKSISRIVEKYDPDQPRDSHGRWTDGGGGSASSDVPLREDSGVKPPPVGTEFLAFRLGSEGGDVSNRNVGNARALADHLVRISDFDAPSFSGGAGNTITVWGITLTEEPTAYVPSVGGTKVARVGRRVRPAGEGESAVSYSLPENGTGYRGRPIARIPMQALTDALRAEGYGNADDAGTNATTRLIRQVTSVLKYVSRYDLEKAYDPRQPRDARGRWTSGGSGAAEEWSSAGVDPAGVPGAEHAGDIPAYLDMVANRVQGGRPSIQGFVLAHGRGFPTDEGSFVGGEPHQCYKNSLLASMSDPDLAYVEGFVSVHGVPIHHAWNVDKDGRVRDHTLGEDSRGAIRGYFGVPIDQDYALAATLRRGKYGLLVHEQHEEVMRAGPGKIVRRYDPDQPRDPAGTSTGGQWSSGGGGDAASAYKEHAALNDWLRGDRSPASGSREENEPIIVAMDKLVADNKLERKTVLYRGFGEGFDIFASTTLTDPAFLSTSTDESVAREFASGGYIAEIVAGKGTNAYTFEDDDQSEVVLPRNTTLRMMSVDHARRVARYRIEKTVEKYDPDQPRDPAGTPTGGQWSSGGGGGVGSWRDSTEFDERVRGAAREVAEAGRRKQGSD